MNKAQVEALLLEGISAARAGDRKKAREILEQVVEIDEQNERAWFWLASVVDTDEERRLYLGNVVIINPNNQRAQELLDKLEQGTRTKEGSAELAPGINRQTALLGALIGGAALLAIVIAVVLGLGGGDDAGSTAGLSTSTATATITLTPSNTPTPAPPTATFTASPPPPTATATATITPTLPPPAADISGQLLMAAGLEFGEDQPIVQAVLGAEITFSVLSADAGRHPSLSNDRQRFVYAMELGNADFALRAVSVDGSTSQFLNEYWGSDLILTGFDMPAWSPTAPQIAFIAERLAADGNGSQDLFIISIAGEPAGDSSVVVQMTNDATDESYPTWSPDGQRLVYVADIPASEGIPGGVDLWAMANGNATSLTTDGSALVEIAPDISPDGTQIVFSGCENSDYGACTRRRSPSDIWIMPADGSAPAMRLFDFGPADVQPRWSPDGNYIVFSSNIDRNSDLNVFIYEIETGAFYRVTSDTGSFDLANEWSP